MYFPTAFTPNNDGRNDQFRGLGNRSVRDYELSVYNRWGEKIFNTRNVLSGWNGKINGVDQPSGIYIWVAGYTTPKGIKKNVKGTTILIR
jgi:gliding motility-associated-like protein